MDFVAAIFLDQRKQASLALPHKLILYMPAILNRLAKSRNKYKKKEQTKKYGDSVK